ncbi:hypothetical protein [Actibacterium sp. MT2.3-13A]|uniref:hypothetical protein n=1 Tax=Actibacterium sp. MT2.3-13A TaxID=2828332 RepID=UPI0020123E07|nr:hypothetical protein [Actibacterium sp. MT2.3-13A]
MDSTATADRCRITGRRTVDPSRLSPSARDAFGRELYAIHRQIFSGVTEERFRSHVIEPPAESTAVQIYLGAGGEVVGYCAVHRYRRRIGGRDTIVLRAEAGLRPEYRGRGTTYWFGMIRALAEKLRHPFTAVYYLGTLVHTSSYHLFFKYFPRVYPHPDLGFPEAARAVALELADSFPDPAADASDPLVRAVGWITIETPQEKALDRRGDLPDVRYFKSRNPGYVAGQGLVVLVPITFGNVAAAMLARLGELARLAVRRHEPPL